MSHQVGLVWQGGNGWDDMVREQVRLSTFQTNQTTETKKKLIIIENNKKSNLFLCYQKKIFVAGRIDNKATFRWKT